MPHRRDTLIAWLRDAHAMERATIDNIKRLLERMEAHPEFVARYDAHLRDSAAQLGRIERCLDALDADRSVLKDTMMRLTGYAEAFTTAIAPDEAVKHGLAAYSYEHFEIASYTSLIAAAESLGLTEVQELCTLSLQEEREMAEWLEQYIPQATCNYLDEAAKDRTPSRPRAAESRVGGRDGARN